MSDNYEYAEMLEIPVQTCTLSVKSAPEKQKRKKRRSTSVKEDAIAVANERVLNEESVQIEPQEQVVEETVKVEEVVQENQLEIAEQVERDDTIEEPEQVVEESVEEPTTKITVQEGKGKRKITLVGLETFAIVALLAFIVLTNIFWSNSGINTLFKIMNGTYVSKVYENNAVYSTFMPIAPADDVAITVNDGVMTINREGSIYAPCDGVVTQIVESAGKYVMEISHSTNFKTVISGVDYAYASLNDKVYATIPVGYLKRDTLTVSLYNGNSLIKDYSINNGEIIWEV